MVENADAVLLPAELSERFEPVRLLAHGCMGRVFHVVDRKTGQHVALKTILPSVASVLNRARFERECRAMASLDHPRVVRFLGGSLAGPMPYVVMELLDGTTLAEQLPRATLERQRAAGLVVAIAEGLVHIHGHGLLHRDLKPSNVFLERSRGPVLIDLGLARKACGATQLTGSDEILGTLDYMAPEVVSDRNYSARSDLFSAALVGAESLTGKGVHDSTMSRPDLPAVLSSLISGTYFSVARRQLKEHGSLGEVLLRALAPCAQDRPRTAREFLDELHRAGVPPAPRRTLVRDERA